MSVSSATRSVKQKLFDQLLQGGSVLVITTMSQFFENPSYQVDKAIFEGFFTPFIDRLVMKPNPVNSPVEVASFSPIF